MKKLNATTLSGAGFVILWAALLTYSKMSPLSGRGGDISYDPLFYPLLLIYAGLALSLGVLAVGLIKAPRASEAASHHFGRLTVAVGLIALYLVLLVPLGFIIDTCAFLLLFGLQLGYRRYGMLAITAVLGTTAVWIVFTQGLRAPLPTWPNIF